MSQIVKPNKKYSPTRTCIACRKKIDQNHLLRIMLDENQNLTFATTKLFNSRSAYICNDKKCLEKCIKKRMLNRAFKKSFTEKDYANLMEKYERQNS